MNPSWCTPLLLLALVSTAAAQDGGKLPWKGKSGDPRSALGDAKSQGKASMLSFTSDG